MGQVSDSLTICITAGLKISRRLDGSLSGPALEALRRKYPEFKDEHALERFKRKWMYMVAYCDAVSCFIYLVCAQNSITLRDLKGDSCHGTLACY